MSQLKNTTTIFQNNDLVTAAKLNSLVTDTSLDVAAVTGQPPPTNLVGTDVVLGYEASTNSLVAIDIDTIRSTSSVGSDLKADNISTIDQNAGATLTIRNNTQNGIVKVEANAGNGAVYLFGGGSGFLFSTPNATRGVTHFLKMEGIPVFISENLEVRGDSVVGNLTSVVGSPIATITFAARPPFVNNPPIELKLDVANPQFDGIALSSGTAGWSGNTYTGGNSSVSPYTLTITLPSNATQAYTGQPIAVRRVALEVKELSYLSRLHVRNESRFDKVCNFLVPPTLNNAAIKPSYDYFVQTRALAVLTSGWGGAQNPANPYGTKIPQLDITFTPQKAGNKVVLEWNIFGETSYSAETVIVVTRTPNSGAGAGVAVALPDAVDASNNTWSGVSTFRYDTDDSSTPSTAHVKIVDMNTLAVSCTYSVHFRHSNNRTSTFHLNRSVSNAGTVDFETGMSVGHAHEIYV